MDSRELSEWMAFEKLEPFGPERLEIMLATLCALTVNINSKKGSKLRTPRDFIPDYERHALASFTPVVSVSSLDLATKLRLLNIGFGGTERTR